MYSATHMLSKARANPVYNQIGGRSRHYYRNVYLYSDHWKELRTKKLEKNPNCEKCGRSVCVDVHHLIYRNLFDVTVDDLQSLCRKCHDEEHEKKINRNENRRLPKRNKESIARDDLWLIFNDEKPNVLLISWILDWILRHYRGIKSRRSHFSVRNLERQKEFDKKHGHIYRSMNNYISIHY